MSASWLGANVRIWRTADTAHPDSLSSVMVETQALHQAKIPTGVGQPGHQELTRRGQMRTIIVAWIGVLLAVPSASAAQSLEPAGRHGGYRYAIDLDNSGRADSTPLRVTIYEVSERRTSGTNYAVLTSHVDCNAGTRIDRIREQFSSRRDPVKTIYDPARVLSVRDNSAVAEQIAVLCQPPTARRSATRRQRLMEFLGLW